MKAVLMCGGVGSKMWPASRQTSPKHFLPLIGNKSLFEINYELLKKKFKANEIYVSTTQDQYALVKKVAAEIPDENYFLEPEMRNTGPAIGFVAAKLYKKYADEPFVIVQTDILREPGEKFLESIDRFERLVLENKKWVTGAIKPPFLMRGVDYMVSGDEIEKGVWQLSDWLQRDREAEIKEAMDDGRAWLHANHYCWTPRLWLESYMRYKPEWAKPLMEIANGGDERKIYPEIVKGPTEEWTVLSVPRGEGMMMELPFNWMDFGTWESLANYLNEKGQMQSGSMQSTRTGRGVLHTPERQMQSGEELQDIFEIDSKGNFYRMPSGKFVATIGVENLVVVDTGDALLICRQDQSGRVGEVVDYLKEKEREELM